MLKKLAFLYFLNYIICIIRIVQTETYQRWENRLKDKKARKIITARLFRLADGFPGDISSVGSVINELRIHYGPGYRIYFQQKSDVVIILLCGGDKSTQNRDIQKAKIIAKELEVN